MATKIGKNKGVWFKFDERDPKSGEACLRNLNKEKFREIRKVCTRKVSVGGIEKEELDEKLFEEMVWDYQIVDLRDLEDDDGNPVHATFENKAFWMRENNVFRTFVEERVGMVDKDFGFAYEVKN